MHKVYFDYDIDMIDRNDIGNEMDTIDHNQWWKIDQEERNYQYRFSWNQRPVDYEVMEYYDDNLL